MGDAGFRRDLYQGTAGYYDRFRVPYPKALSDDLLERVDTADRGTLLDLVCGTGQITFALHNRFAEVWAADQEPGMTDLVRQKAAAAGIANIRVLSTSSPPRAPVLAASPSSVPSPVTSGTVSSKTVLAENEMGAASLGRASLRRAVPAVGTALW